MTLSNNKCSSLRDKFENCLSQQLIEYEVLQSMYPNPNDIILTNKDIIRNINDFLEKRIEFVPNHLDFTLNLFIDNMKLEIYINLPTDYPEKEPDISVRCNELNRQQESKLNAELSEYVKKNQNEEVCLYSVITWLQEHIESQKLNLEVCKPTITKSKPEDEKFERLWIFSHHIYNKKKRESIVSKAKDFNITGFCLPGKPGIICIEGNKSYCMEWWKEIKSMNWKKIMIRKQEVLDNESLKKFTNFTELNFSTNHNKHGNMSELNKYLSNLGFSEIFNEFFRLGSES